MESKFLKTMSKLMMIFAIIFSALGVLFVTVALLILCACFVQGATSLTEIAGTHSGMVLSLLFIYGIVFVIFGGFALVCGILGRKQICPVLCLVFASICLIAPIIAFIQGVWVTPPIIALILLYIIATCISIKQKKQAKAAKSDYSDF